MFQTNATLPPEENWFFYWKTSATLWPEKLALMEKKTPLIVPLNWAFHCEIPDRYCFSERAETNLKKLEETAIKEGHEIIFFLPVGPIPWLPNGGLPPFLAKTCAVDTRGIVYGVLDNERNLHKLYSFFDTDIHRHCSRFFFEIGKYFSKMKMESPVYGIRCGFFVEDSFHLFFEDTSRVFDQGFRRYLNVKEEKKVNEKAKKEFTDLIVDLYLDEAQKNLKDHWSGVFDMAVLGGAPNSFFNRFYTDSWNYSREIFSALRSKKLICSLLLPFRTGNDPSLHQLKDIVVPYQNRKLIGESNDFSPLCFFKIDDEDCAGMTGLDVFLKREFGGMYRYTKSGLFDERDDSLCFFLGERETVSSLIEKFKKGKSIILDTSFLSEEAQKELEIFFAEKASLIEEVNVFIPLINISSNKFRFVSFDGRGLESLSLEEKVSFWRQLIGTFSIPYLKIQGEDVDYFWQTGRNDSAKLDYREMRRVYVYNPGGDKKKVKIPFRQNIVLDKVVQKINSSVVSSPKFVEINLAPKGITVLDYGVVN